MTQKDFWQRHPADYIPPDRDIPGPEVNGRFQDPRGWIREINPERFTPGRDVNCGECARATELSWRGVPAVSARNGDPIRFGEPAERMEEWSRKQLDPMGLDDIEATLQEAGPGASALVAVSWKRGGAHWFNAVNHEGEVLVLDGQRGSVERWPPSRGISRFDESAIQRSFAIIFGPEVSDGRGVHD
ncbi:toxin glutamine deamidase domain-containing protein [Frankia sp. AgB32]|uniref:toxin glutamine deamidase domain-containing protein n=1 Tax=Frankia sp. AgB32 TaxID=631119 RepID=UPI00200DFF79|nr:toxin glutamine deamidase domain-containing protein [Frankia sp. AgB32]MCK9897502.1 toxin glutamine deamidase domain-containing protein [Frankia sp. AgB32]